MSSRRTRRSPDEARRMILDAAASLLAEGGVAAVQVRAVAARVEMTDAGVTHHFGNREKLLEELLRHGGRELRAALGEVLSSWLDGEPDVHDLVTSLHAVYRRGYGELGVALHAAGWRDRSSGILNPVVEALHRLRASGSSIEDTRLAVAALHQAAATDGLYGNAFRRSAGLTGRAAGDPAAQLRWWTGQLELALGLPTEIRSPPCAREVRPSRRDG